MMVIALDQHNHQVVCREMKMVNVLNVHLGVIWMKNLIVWLLMIYVLNLTMMKGNVWVVTVVIVY